MYSLLLSALLSTSPAHAGLYGLNTVKGMVTDPAEPVLSVPNMPAVRAQSRVGLCASFTAATLVDYALCVKNGVVNCAGESEERRAAVLDLARFSFVLDEGGDSRFAYDALKEGGYTPLILYNLVETGGHLATEGCAPFAKFVEGIDPRGTESVWDRFQDVYASKAEPGQTYGQFLDTFLIPRECIGRKKWLRLGDLKMDFFPKKDSFAAADGKKEKRAKTLTKIKELLGRNIPVSIDFCGDVPFDEKKTKNFANCANGHALAIKGYKRVCTSGGAKKCRNLLQVQNSWGQEWQDANDDGWVDGDPLLDRTFYELNQFSWLEPEQ